jgi:hypothetical protein
LSEWNQQKKIVCLQYNWRILLIDWESPNVRLSRSILIKFKHVCVIRGNNGLKKVLSQMYWPSWMKKSFCIDKGDYIQTYVFYFIDITSAAIYRGLDPSSIEMKTKTTDASTYFFVIIPMYFIKSKDTFICHIINILKL